MRLLTAAVTVLLSASIAPVWGVNPYCVAGYGVLTKLGMPAGCTDYNWNWLQTDRPIEMVRPNHYYNYIGITPGWFQYNELTDQINDPAQFNTWVTNNPGKIWIIGNEPDIAPQDGLTKDQYVSMFKKYYDTIKAIDPTARFCIGAITGGSTADGFNYTRGWYQDVLNLWRQRYGTTMPIDIWNIHSYCGPKQIEDPARIITEFVTPFVNWCHTVESGAYAGCEVWITEFPIGEWMGAVSVENTIWFMQHYTPRLEQAGVSKFFWYVSSDWDGFQGSCPLVDKNGQVTAVGAAYAALANSYPNAVPPVNPFVPDPTPSWCVSEFSGTLAAPWFNKGGYWSFTDGELRQTGTYPWSGTSCALLYTYQDSGVSFRMKVTSAPDPANWGGVGLRVANRMQTVFDSGYLFLVRLNGEIALYNKTDGTYASVPGAVADPQNWHSYRVMMQGYNIKVWVDGTLKLDRTDVSSRFSEGYTIAQCHKASVCYDDFHVLKYPTPSPIVTDDGAFTTELNHLHASWTCADPGCGIQSYSYAVGTTSGGTDVLGWTSTTQASFDAPVTLSVGSKYYVSVRALYPDGFESAVATSDGITAAVESATTRDLRALPLNTYAIVREKVVSGVFPDGVYVQEPDRTSGIRVKGLTGRSVGDVVTLTGRVGLENQEIVLQDATLVSSTPGAAPRPLLMTNRATGGSAIGAQPAPADGADSTATGLYPIGLLVRTTGTVAAVDPAGSWTYIDDGSGIQDGSGQTGVRVSLAGLPIPAVGASAEVTACCAATDVGGRCVRLLRPRSAQDAHFSAIADYLADGSFESGSLSAWQVLDPGAAVVSGTWYFSITAHSGDRFCGVYGNYAVYSGALLQMVQVPAGAYRASVWSRVLHGGNTVEAAKSRIGIDTHGAICPTAPCIQWSEWDSQSAWYFSEWHQLTTPQVTTTGGPVSVFLQYQQQETAGWHINCFDEARLFSE